MATTAHPGSHESGRRVFSHVLVGVNGSQHALEATRQAALLQAVDGQLTLLSVWDTVHGAAGATAAEKDLDAATDCVAPYAAAARKLVRGEAVAALLEEIEREGATLVAVGSSSGSVLGIVEGAVATEMVHRASCSVLVARPAHEWFPRRVVVGVDGSIESAAAYAAARYVAERFEADLQALVAWGGQRLDERLVALITEGDHDDCGEAPVDALAEASRSADLVVVGSSGPHGVRALGSVSERVADTASCSALVVREPVPQRADEGSSR